MNNPLKQNEVLRSTKTQLVDVCYIVETKVKEANKDVVACRWQNWNLWTNHREDSSGRIWVFAKREVSITPILQSPQFMHFVITFAGQSLTITFVYGSNEQHERRQLWADLLQIQINSSQP